MFPGLEGVVFLTATAYMTAQSNFSAYGTLPVNISYVVKSEPPIIFLAPCLLAWSVIYMRQIHETKRVSIIPLPRRKCRLICLVLTFLRLVQEPVRLT